jgi:hypothetical protein
MTVSGEAVGDGWAIHGEWYQMGYWFFGGPTIEELRQDLRGVLKKCRADWDISSAEHKAAWQRGEKDKFYPYGKGYAKVFGEQG